MLDINYVWYHCPQCSKMLTSERYYMCMDTQFTYEDMLEVWIKCAICNKKFKIKQLNVTCYP